MLKAYTFNKSSINEFENFIELSTKNQIYLVI